ncbi:MAG TPA: TauD/TfdA family dioxygenase [Crenalkalicoccus sp.]|jgi:hypothetical protein|nr:TauD/TfdA family dioxygenase [Crenalkalicoccus sp.]
MSPSACLPHTPLAGRSAWTRADLEADRNWVFEIAPAQAEELAAAALHLAEVGRGAADLQPGDCLLPTLSLDMIRLLWREVARGRGFAVVRGLDPARFGEAAALFHGLALQLGRTVSQNRLGHRIGPVCDPSPGLHTDPGDVLGLLCLRRGAAISLVSAASLFNALLQDRPETLPVLARGFFFDRGEEGTPFQGPVSPRQPVLAQVEGDLSARYARRAIETAWQKLGEAPSAAEAAALEAWEEAAARPALRHLLQLAPGDVLLVNNYAVLHEAAPAEAEPTRRPALLRLWLRIDGFRHLNPAQCDYDPETGWSRRDGVLPQAGAAPQEGLLAAAE